MENRKEQMEKGKLAGKLPSRSSVIVLGVAFMMLLASLLVLFFALEKYQRSRENLGDTTIVVERYESNPGVTGTVAQAAQAATPCVAEVSACDKNYERLLSGSAVCVLERGEFSFLVTNQHVIRSAEHIIVTTPDGTSLEAVLWGYDYVTDLAVLRVDKHDSLKPARLGISEGVGIGQEVITVGNPTGSLPGSVSTGIVSYPSRLIITNGEHTTSMMQFDAAISRGSSGGGLFDMAGTLIGIVSARSADSSAENIGFAIPFDTVFGVFQWVIESHPNEDTQMTLGIELDANMNVLSFAYSDELHGTVKTEMGDELAYAILPGDKLRYIDGYAIQTLEDYNAAIARLHPGQWVTVTICRTYIPAGKTQEYSANIVVEISAKGLEK